MLHVNAGQSHRWTERSETTPTQTPSRRRTRVTTCVTFFSCAPMWGRDDIRHDRLLRVTGDQDCRSAWRHSIPEPPASDGRSAPHPQPRPVAAVAMPDEYGISFGLPPLDLHPGRSDRHRRNRETGDLRHLLGKHPPYRERRNMPFDRQAVHSRRMAREQFDRCAEHPPEWRNRRDHSISHCESFVADVTDPAFAASAIRIPPHFDPRGLPAGRRRKNAKSTGDESAPTECGATHRALARSHARISSISRRCSRMISAAHFRAVSFFPWRRTISAMSMAPW